MKISPVTDAIGATVTDIDLRRVDADDIAELNAAWGDHGVLFFRNQELTPDDHIAFAEKFAAIDVNRFFQPVETHPNIAQVLKEADQELNIGGGWHTDHSYDQIPARGSILLAREVPPVGGDTQFLSVGAAYEALSDGLKATLRTLKAHHTNEHVFGTQSNYNRDMGGRLGNPEGVGSAEHPIVIEHPVSGRPMLYINMGFTTHIVGWTPEESKPLLDYLYTHTLQEQFMTTFKWEPGSVAMWDNRSTWHYAVNDYHGHRRLMHRITVQGDALHAA